MKGLAFRKKTSPKLFEPFFRAKQPDAYVEGTGLGLSIVKEVVEQHRGRLQVVSEEGEGSTFSVYLPVVETDAE